MLESVVVALITGGLSLIGVIVSVSASSSKTQAEFKATQAVMETKINELTREVREHNDFAHKIPVMQEQIKNLNDKVSVMETQTVIRKV